VLSFIYGIPPSEILDECRKQKIKTIGAATTPEEASALEQAGFEFMVASSFEGGGHRGSFLRSPAESLMGGFALIPQVGDTSRNRAVFPVLQNHLADIRNVTLCMSVQAFTILPSTVRFVPVM
jgi:nitronate monooxygenase